MCLGWRKWALPISFLILPIFCFCHRSDEQEHGKNWPFQGTYDLQIYLTSQFLRFFYTKNASSITFESCYIFFFFCIFTPPITTAHPGMFRPRRSLLNPPHHTKKKKTLTPPPSLSCSEVCLFCLDEDGSYRQHQKCIPRLAPRPSRRLSMPTKLNSYD